MQFSSRRCYAPKQHDPICRARVEAGDSNEAVKASARGLLLWKAALARGLLPDDVTLAQLAADVDSPVYGWPLAALRWPDEPLRAVLIRAPAPPLRWVPQEAPAPARLPGASPALATLCARPLLAVPARRAGLVLHAMGPLAAPRANRGAAHHRGAVAAGRRALLQKVPCGAGRAAAHAAGAHLQVPEDRAGVRGLLS